MSDQGQSGDRYPPLSSYALLGDCHSAALVSRDGSIDWCCFHRFDARPVFARLLDWSRGGHFRVAPAGTAYTIGRRYLPGTNVLETRMATSSGSVTVTDCLVVRRGALAGDAAQTRSHHQLLRLVYCEAGEVEVALEFAPRFDYGLTTPRTELRGPDCAVVYGGADALALQSQIPLTQSDAWGCRGTLRLRYSWLRDAALNLYALFTLGYTEEAHDFMAWLERTTAGRAEDLQIMYGVGGERQLPEVLLGELEGWRGSRPVRIGNAAAEQFQLDVYGYLLDTAWLYHRHGGEISATFWGLLCGAVDVVARRWTEPDEGIWEVRGDRRHFVSSKVMAWVAVDRAIRLARARSLPADLDRWSALRAAIRRWVERDGVDPSGGALTQSLGDPALDASNLLIPLVRFLPAADPRVRATMRRIAGELSRDGLVYRYLEDDGLPGGEATFLICSFWMVDNLALAGETDRAHDLFERLLGYANDLGLLAEEVDPGSGELLGNFPQAFSHVGLIGAALNLATAPGGRVPSHASASIDPA